MTHNKFLPRVLAAAAAMMLLAGCGSKADPGFSPANPVNITIWTYYNGEQLEAFNALVDEFNSTVGKEQGITVESSSHGSVTDLENNVLASAEGKVGAEAMPNIFSAYADTAYALDEMGQIANLSDYLSEEDRAAFIEDYLSEGDFSGSGSIKIFPVAKSVELLFLNETDWEPFAAATGATYDDLATIEGLVSVAERYYEWTDAQTPDIPNDGRAFFGRDAMANYMLIGAKQLGCTIFDAQDGSMTLNFDHDAVRTLWDNYYVPFIKGYRDYETYLPKCKEITEQLGDMIRDILNASRLQTQGNNEPCSNFSLRTLLTELCEPYRLIAEAKGIKFKIELSSDAFVYLPEGRLKKAISNILSNAVNYTKAGQSISVVFDKNKLSVSNECSVLPPEQLQHIFEPFYRPDLAHSQATGGNGLGLYIVQTILDKLRLKYQFVPMPNDRGMSFTIQF